MKRRTFGYLKAPCPSIHVQFNKIKICKWKQYIYLEKGKVLNIIKLKYYKMSSTATIF